MVEGQHKSAPEFYYHLLRSALDSFNTNPDLLDDARYEQVHRKASRSYEIETCVLASPEARDVVVPDEQLDQSISEIASRYESREAFIQDLEANGLDSATLRKALYRELIFNSVMQRVAASSADVTDLDVRLFYEMHHERFEEAERRVARHILVTVNPDYPENSYTEARARIVWILEKLAGRANRFEKFAERYSECPTAMDGGMLGEVGRGQLFASLDTVLFGMKEGWISPVVESELGFHVLLCEKIIPARWIPFSRVAPKIHKILQERRRRNCQKAWLARLMEVSTRQDNH